MSTCINIHEGCVSSHPSPWLHHKADFHHKETTQFTPTSWQQQKFIQTSKFIKLVHSQYVSFFLFSPPASFAVKLHFFSFTFLSSLSFYATTKVKHIHSCEIEIYLYQSMFCQWLCFWKACNGLIFLCLLSSVCVWECHMAFTLR